MAPARKRGASKAAATMAACRKFKPGDLVLAKVKGFPAWPATVSEPEKWGYSNDWKKVLVYFFGTQQIAFCNPVDVEAFTEEKKNSIQIRPHGKGADFVRAVHEIVDSYEKLKKQDQGVNVPPLYGVTIANGSKAVESLADSGLNDEAHDVIVKSSPKTSISTRTKKSSRAATRKDALHGKETPSEEPTEIIEIPLQTTYSRKKYGVQAQNFVIQKRAPSARRSRIASRHDSLRFQDFISPSSNISKSVGNVSSSSLRDGSLRRNKRIRKSPVASEENNVDLPPFVSNGGSPEENGSEIVTADSDSRSFEEVSTVESDYNLLQPEHVVESCDGNVKLNQILDFQGKTGVVKKKRKPSRKRASIGATELIPRVDRDTCLEVEVPKTDRASPSDLDNLYRKYTREDKNTCLEVEVPRTDKASPCDHEYLDRKYTSEDNGTCLEVEVPRTHKASPRDVENLDRKYTREDKNTCLEVEVPKTDKASPCDHEKLDRKYTREDKDTCLEVEAPRTDNVSPCDHENLDIKYVREDKDTCLEVEVPRTDKVSPRDHENLDRKYTREDGDGHLPLVKRARVRMGRPSSTGEELDALAEPEEKPLEVLNNCLVQVCSALKWEEDSPVKGNLEKSSPSNKCDMNKPPLREVKKHQQFGCSMDILAKPEEKPTEVLNSSLVQLCSSLVEGNFLENLSPSNKCAMNKPSLWDVQKHHQFGCSVDALAKSEEKPSEVINSTLVQLCSALKCEEDGPVDRSSLVVKGSLEYSSPSNKCAMNKPPFWEVKKHQQFGCSVDGEAALPPSKRIHRALEAMSANAAEDDKTYLGAPSSLNFFLNGSFKRERSSMYSENRTKTEIEVQNVDTLNNIVSQHPMTESSASLNLRVRDESSKSFIEVASCSSPVKIYSSPEQVCCKDLLAEAVDCADEINPNASLDAPKSGTVVLCPSPKSLSPTLGRKHDCLGSNQGFISMILPSNDGKIKNPGSRGSCQEDDPSQLTKASSGLVSDDMDIAIQSPQNDTSQLSKESSGPVSDDMDIAIQSPHNDTSQLSKESSGPVSDDMDIAIQSPQNDTNMLISGPQNNCQIIKLLKFPSGENDQENKMCNIVKEARPILKDSNAAPTPITVEIMQASVQDSHISNPSLSEDCLSQKAVSGIRSSSSPTDDSTPRASPPSTSVPNMSTSDTSNLIENNGCCSPEPDAHVHHEKPKHASKFSNKGEASAALASFEAILGTLTRTKECIGRATRIAIDCAKFGNATKVLQIIACNLEREPSLHRRVDLFFLVDSIAQCSRGFKGNVGGGMYPSVIQAALPRLLLAAAPPGSSALENRRQCLKVLRLWQDRKILPESVIRRHIRDLDSLSNSSSTGAFSRRPMRTERAFDDPLREMEGVVDEYGSNSSFQLPGFRMPPMLKDEDQKSDSDGESFEAVTPEHNSEIPEEREWAPTPAVEKRRHILEDVDGELEMEDVAPPCEAEMSSTPNVPVINTADTLHNRQFEKHYPLSFAPPLPMDVPPLSTPPLPTSPPPPPPGLDSKLYVGTHNKKDDLLQSAAQRPVVPRINPTISDFVHYNASETKEPHRLTKMESANNHVIQAVNSVQQADGAALHNTPFHLRPPHPAPSNQFSYVQADHQLQPRMDAPPPSYLPNRFHFDNGSFYSDQDRMKLAPHEIGESWRFSAPLSGPCYPDSGRPSFAPVPYTGIPCEPAIPNPSWAFPRGMNHRELIPHRPPSDGPVPVATRAPNYWRPR